jgi:hypothetical protein
VVMRMRRIVSMVGHGGTPFVERATGFSRFSPVVRRAEWGTYHGDKPRGSPKATNTPSPADSNGSTSCTRKPDSPRRR